MNRGVLAALALLALVGCPKAAAGSDANEGPMTMKVTFSPARLDAGRPPLTVLRTTLTVENTGAVARWFLVPSALPSTAGGVDGVEVRSGGGVSLGRFQGPGAFYALLVAPGATVTVQDLAIESWAEGPVQQVEITLRSGVGVSVGGEPIEAWMAGGPSRGVVHADALLGTGKRFTPDRGAVPVVVNHEEQIVARLFVR